MFPDFVRTLLDNHPALLAASFCLIMLASGAQDLNFEEDLSLENLIGSILQWFFAGICVVVCAYIASNPLDVFGSLCAGVLHVAGIVFILRRHAQRRKVSRQRSAGVGLD